MLISVAGAALLFGPTALLPTAAAAVSCDVGFDTPVVGVPRWAPAGAVVIGDTVVRPTTDRQRPQDFGAAIVTSDFDNDGCVDLLVGAPAASGGGAVYLINGDSHVYNQDHPLAAGSAWLSFYGQATAAKNLTRVTVDGSKNAKDWLKVTVNPEDSVTVMSFERIPFTHPAS